MVNGARGGQALQVGITALVNIQTGMLGKHGGISNPPRRLAGKHRAHQRINFIH